MKEKKVRKIIKEEIALAMQPKPKRKYTKRKKPTPPSVDTEVAVINEHIVLETVSEPPQVRISVNLHENRPGYNPYNNNPFGPNLRKDVFNWDSHLLKFINS